MIVDHFINVEKQPLILARYIQQHLNNNGEDNFNQILRNTLYARQIIESNLLREIGQLLNSETSQSPDSIITYNYDDILEVHLKKLNIPHKAIYDDGMEPNEGELPIYHVHGFLSREVNSDTENEIVLSEEMYHERYTDIHHWSNQTQINKFSQKTCLFIGTSLTDPNMRRLLDIASKQRKNEEKPHFRIEEKPNVTLKEKIEQEVYLKTVLRFLKHKTHGLWE